MDFKKNPNNLNILDVYTLSRLFNKKQFMLLIHAHEAKYKQGEMGPFFSLGLAVCWFLKNKALLKVPAVSNKVTLVKSVWVIAIKM